MAQGGGQIVHLADVSGINRFDPAGDVSSVGTRWTRWVRSFELFAEGRGVTVAAQKKALLLHCAGEAVQDIYYTLTEGQPGEGQTVYDVSKALLNEHFKPKTNIAFERSQFRGMAQTASETIEQFITRLRQKAIHCGFTDVDESIRDQVIEKCQSTRLRRKLLEKGDITLKTLRETALLLESSERQVNVMENKQSEDVNFVGSKSNSQQGARNKTYGSASRPSYSHNHRNKEKDYKKCFACGYSGHLKADSKCPAKTKHCRNCKKIGHFESMCKGLANKDKRGKRGRSRKGHVNLVESSESDGEDEYVFCVNQNKDTERSNKVTVLIGNVPVSVIIDSGASVNVIDQQTWEMLKKQQIKCKSRLTNKRLYAYGHENPMEVLGCFTALVQVENTSVEAEFMVVKGSGTPLLGKQTSIDLNILYIKHPVYNVESGSGIKQRLLSKFNCFEGLGKLKGYQLNIPLNHEIKPVVQPVRRIPYGLRDKIDQEIERLEQLDIIEKVNGPSQWVSPIVAVPKKDGVRICVDMRRANEAVLRERYPIPTVEEILQEMNNSKVFSKLDIRMAYHQIELDQESREVTTFMTHKGMYRYKRLMFGVSCAPELYNKVLAQVMSDLPGVSSIFDDIIVHGESVTEHDKRLEALLSRFQEKGLTLNLDKCQFNMPHIDFMGLVLSKHGIGLSESKVQAVLDARPPKTVSEIKSFLGLVNFSARFIPNLASIAEPIRKLTRKGETFVWGTEQDKSFTELKEALSNADNLGYFNKADKTQVICDAGPVGLGCVLIQENKQGESRVIMYASRSLTTLERKYSQTEKEALAIVWACERLHMYLIGIDFELLTDHRPLQFMFSPRSKISARVERWVLRLQPYRYTVKYIPGPQNIADSLSRLLPEEPSVHKDTMKTEKYIHFVATESTPVAMTTKQIEQISSTDSELNEVRDCIKTGKWYKLSNKHYLPIRHELAAIGQLILRGTRIVIPGELREEILKLGHEGHPGIVIMKQRLRQKVWWPNMDRDIEKHCKYCESCQLVSKPENPEPLVRRELPIAPWQDLAIDFLGPLPTGESILVVVDYYSRWIEIDVMKSTTSERVIKSLTNMFSVHGLPLSIQSDNAQQFSSTEFETYLVENGIEHHKTTPLWPQANGEVERQNRSIMKRVRIAHAENRNWRDDLQTYLLMCRSTPHSTTGRSPAELLFNRKIRTKLPDIGEFHRETDLEIRDKDSEQKGKGKVYADEKRKARESEINPGDEVLMKQKKENKLSTTFHKEPMKVLSKSGNSVLVRSSKGATYRRNVSHLKKFYRKSDRVYDENDYEEEEDVYISPEENPSVEMSNQSVRSDQKVEKSNNESVCSPNSEIKAEYTMPEPAKIDNSGVQNIPEPITRPSRVRKLPKKYDDFVLK